MARRRPANLRRPLRIACYTVIALDLLLIPLTFCRITRLGRIGAQSTLMVNFYNARVFIVYQWGPAIPGVHVRARVATGQCFAELVPNDFRDRDPRGAVTPTIAYRPPVLGAVPTNSFRSIIISLPLWLIDLAAPIPPAVFAWRARHAVPPGHCPKCRYDLTANTSGTCPECGMPVPPAATTL